MILSVVTNSGAAAIRLKYLDGRHCTPPQPVWLAGVAGARHRGGLASFEPLRRRSIANARVFGETAEAHVARHVVSPMGCLSQL
jgi:hypothetical protein